MGLSNHEMRWIHPSYTDKQAVDGYSLDAQSAKIKALAMLKCYELIEIIADDESAKNLKRPGVQRVIQMVKERAVNAVLIMKLDRFTRSVKDLAEMVDLFNSNDVALVSLTESLDTKTAAGELSLNITTSVSQWERRAIGERTRTALEYKKSIGERLGCVPYGYHPDITPEQAKGLGIAAKLVPDATEQGMIASMQTLRGAGNTLKAIAAHLNAAGQLTRKGTAWRLQYIDAILKAQSIAMTA